MGADEDRPLTPADRIEAFRIATSSFADRYADVIARGMTDSELESALVATLGTFGGSGGPGRMSISFAGAGLRIWAGWHVVNHVREKPIFSGKETIRMAREVYGIADPENKQLKLF